MVSASKKGAYIDNMSSAGDNTMKKSGLILTTIGVLLFTFLVSLGVHWLRHNVLERDIVDQPETVSSSKVVILEKEDIQSLSAKIRRLEDKNRLLETQIDDLKDRMYIEEQGGVKAVIASLHQELNAVETGKIRNDWWFDRFAIVVRRLSVAGADPREIDKLLDRVVSLATRAKFAASWTKERKQAFSEDVKRLRKTK